MELSACIAAMNWVQEEGIRRRYSRVQIFSDSQYVVNGQFSAPFWQKSKWRTAAGRPIDNCALWKEFLSAKSKAGIRIDICKVQNKSTPLLKRVDKLAKTAAKSYPRIDRGLVVGKNRTRQDQGHCYDVSRCEPGARRSYRWFEGGWTHAGEPIRL